MREDFSPWCPLLFRRPWLPTRPQWNVLFLNTGKRRSFSFSPFIFFYHHALFFLTQKIEEVVHWMHRILASPKTAALITGRSWLWATFILSEAIFPGSPSALVVSLRTVLLDSEVTYKYTSLVNMIQNILFFILFFLLPLLLFFISFLFIFLFPPLLLLPGFWVWDIQPKLGGSVCRVLNDFYEFLYVKVLKLGDVLDDLEGWHSLWRGDWQNPRIRPKHPNLYQNRDKRKSIVYNGFNFCKKKKCK